MSIPLFTHQCGGCKPLMDLHPALRDYHANRNGPDAPAERVGERRRTARSVIRGARFATVCVACTVLMLGSLIVP